MHPMTRLNSRYIYIHIISLAILSSILTWLFIEHLSIIHIRDQASWQASRRSQLSTLLLSSRITFHCQEYYHYWRSRQCWRVDHTIYQDLLWIGRVCVIIHEGGSEWEADMLFNLSANVTRNILVCMTELMVMLVDESESLSEDVIEMTLEQIQKVMKKRRWLIWYRILRWGN